MSQQPQQGSAAETCAQPSTQLFFNASQYTGLWYEIYRLPFIEEQDAYCVTARYTLNPNGTIRVENRARRGSTTAAPFSAIGEAMQNPNASDPAKLVVDFPESPAPPGNYWVLSTNYNQYAIVYSCNITPQGRRVNAWILSREPTLDEDVLRVLFTYLKRAADIDSTDFIKTPQTGCPAEQP